MIRLLPLILNNQSDMSEKGIRPIGSEVPLPTNSDNLRFVNKVEHPFTETDIKPYEPFKSIGLSTDEIPDEIIVKAQELGIEKVLRIAREIIDGLEKVIPVIEWFLGWFNITPKKAVDSKQRLSAVSDAIDILTRLKK